ncbi:MAG: regulatory iron-sulfur-containing complex subunit RicT [Nitrospirota bacterium]
MPEVIGVRFKDCGKIFDFDINGIDISTGDKVVVESDLGLTIGDVVIERRAVENPEQNLKKILRKATEEDMQQRLENIKLEEEAKNNCMERIMARGLPMKLISTEVTLDRKRIIFYFTAEKRIDFRELVKDLAAKFKTRIEMRQIGVRDGAKMIGSLGICGMEICCRKFLTSFEPISIKMAKKQELVLNTGKLSGICGRLMCCLGFEHIDVPLEDIQTEADAMPVVEDTEEREMIVASSDALIESEVALVQNATESNLPEKHEQEASKERKKWPVRKRRRRSHRRKVR